MVGGQQKRRQCWMCENLFKAMSDARIRRWDEISLEKVTEMVSRKVVVGDGLKMVQVYLKRGAHVPLHRHDDEQMIYVLQGALRCEVAGREVTVRDGEVLHVPAGMKHQAEALDDTFQIVLSAPACPSPDPGPQDKRRTSSEEAPSST